MVEHTNQPSCIQADGFDVKLYMKKMRHPRYLNCSTMCKMVSLTNRGKGGRVGVGFLGKKIMFQSVKEQKFLINPSADGSIFCSRSM